MNAPSVIVFDVNETLSDLSSMGQRFADVGAPEWVAKLWFASLLRDGFALNAAGATERFSAIGEGALTTVLAGFTLNRHPLEAVEYIMSGFLELPVHHDVVEAVEALSSMGVRLVTLTNGSTTVAERLLARAGIHGHFERLLSVEEAGVWKPAPGAYEYAARMCSVDPGEMLLVAVHPWDIDGAGRSGLRTAWINRQSGLYPGYFLAPEYSASTLTDLAEMIVAL